MPAAGKKALMINAPSYYRDEELVDTRRVLENAGAAAAGGAAFTREQVVRDGNFITADGSKAAEKSGRMLVESLG